jgi:hypothetical protein
MLTMRREHDTAGRREVLTIAVWVAVVVALYHKAQTLLDCEGFHTWTYIPEPKAAAL